jgi:hypothetical protein
LKVGQEECDKGETAKAAATLTEVVAAIEKISANIK